MDAVTHTGDPQVGNLATPLNSSVFSRAFIQNLPAYRSGLSANRRGLEIGMAHGYFLYGPFLVLGPLRGTDSFELAGLLSAVGMVAILTIALSLYASAMGGKPIATVTAPNIPEDLNNKAGWSDFATGFFIGGCGGAFFAYFLCSTAHLGPLQDVVKGVWSS